MCAVKIDVPYTSSITKLQKLVTLLGDYYWSRILLISSEIVYIKRKYIPSSSKYHLRLSLCVFVCAFQNKVIWLLTFFKWTGQNFLLVLFPIKWVVNKLLLFLCQWTADDFVCLFEKLLYPLNVWLYKENQIIDVIFNHF